MTDMMSAGALFRRYGCDKDMDNIHYYGPIYDALYPYRTDVKLVLEIGTAAGAGLLAFRDMYPNATIVGVDMHSCVAGAQERIEFHQGRLEEHDFLMRVVAGREFDLIIEDASHLRDDNLRTLFWLFPYVRSGGFYVAEEWYNISAEKECFNLFEGAQVIRTDHPSQTEEILVIKKK